MIPLCRSVRGVEHPSGAPHIGGLPLRSVCQISSDTLPESHDDVRYNSYAYIKGTKIKAMPNHTSGECCAACTADKECQGWNMPGPHGSDGNDCQLMGSPLVMFNGGQGSTGCAAGVKDPDGRSSCWYVS